MFTNHRPQKRPQTSAMKNNNNGYTLLETDDSRVDIIPMQRMTKQMAKPSATASEQSLRELESRYAISSGSALAPGTTTTTTTATTPQQQQQQSALKTQTSLQKTHTVVAVPTTQPTAIHEENKGRAGRLMFIAILLYLIGILMPSVWIPNLIGDLGSAEKGILIAQYVFDGILILGGFISLLWLHPSGYYHHGAVEAMKGVLAIGIICIIPQVVLIYFATIDAPNIEPGLITNGVIVLAAIVFQTCFLIYTLHVIKVEPNQTEIVSGDDWSNPLSGAVAKGGKVARALNSFEDEAVFL